MDKQASKNYKYMQSSYVIYLLYAMLYFAIGTGAMAGQIMDNFWGQISFAITSFSPLLLFSVFTMFLALYAKHKGYSGYWRFLQNLLPLTIIIWRGYLPGVKTGVIKTFDKFSKKDWALLLKTAIFLSLSLFIINIVFVIMAIINIDGIGFDLILWIGLFIVSLIINLVFILKMKQRFNKVWN